MAEGVTTDVKISTNMGEFVETLLSDREVQIPLDLEGQERVVSRYRKELIFLYLQKKNLMEPLNLSMLIT